MATLLVGMVMVGALNSVGGALKMWRAAAHRSEAYGLAEQLMSEIMQQQYKEAGTLAILTDLGESLTNRSNWDDVDDYHGWSSSPESKDGSALVGYESWNREVTVKWVRRDAPHTTSITDTGLKRINVTVTDPDGEATTLTAWRSNAGILETPPQANTTVQSWIGNKLAVGNQGVLHNGTTLLNQAE